MTAITYTAKRSVIAGHTAGTDYSIDVVLEQADKSVRPVVDQQRSISGAQETLLHRVDVTWQIVIGSINNAGLPAMREFLDSVYAGEAFIIDIYGSVATADSPINVEATPGYQERRVNGTNWYVVPMTLRVI